MDSLDKLDFLYREIEYAKSKLQPQDTGHINTAISWMEHRISEIKKELRSAKIYTKKYQVE
jgi:hypothetical protein